MRISVDTNVLVRLLVVDDEDQARAAAQALEQASLVAIGLVTLCEVAWVVKSAYKIPPQQVAAFFRKLISIQKVQLDLSAVEAGLAHVEAGGDFADGIIAHEGSWLGGETFVSFDKRAVKLLSDRGTPTKLLR